MKLFKKNKVVPSRELHPQIGKKTQPTPHAHVFVHEDWIPIVVSGANSNIVEKIESGRNKPPVIPEELPNSLTHPVTAIIIPPDFDALSVREKKIYENPFNLRRHSAIPGFPYLTERVHSSTPTQELQISRGTIRESAPEGIAAWLIKAADCQLLRLTVQTMRGSRNITNSGQQPSSSKQLTQTTVQHSANAGESGRSSSASRTKVRLRCSKTVRNDAETQSSGNPSVVTMVPMQQKEPEIQSVAADADQPTTSSDAAQKQSVSAQNSTDILPGARWVVVSSQNNPPRITTTEVEELSIAAQRKQVRCCFVSLYNRPVDIYWQKNKESYVYGQLQYHEMLQVDTYEGHLWYFYDAIDGQQLQIVHPVVSLYYVVKKSQRLESDVVYVFVGMNFSKVSLLKTCLRYLYDYISEAHGKKDFQTPELIQSLGLGIDVQKKMALYFISALEYQSNVNPAFRPNCAQLTDRLVISMHKIGERVTYETGATPTDYELVKRMRRPNRPLRSAEAEIVYPILRRPNLKVPYVFSNENPDEIFQQKSDFAARLKFKNPSVRLKRKEFVTHRRLLYFDGKPVIEFGGVEYDMSSMLNRNLDDPNIPSSSRSLRQPSFHQNPDEPKECITSSSKKTAPKLPKESAQGSSSGKARDVKDVTESPSEDVVYDDDQL